MSGRLILIRHGQSHANVERRLDTRPPGADLTDLGVQQARDYARARTSPPALLLHSVARRAAQTAAAIGAQLASAAGGGQLPSAAGGGQLPSAAGGGQLASAAGGGQLPPAAGEFPIMPIEVDGIHEVQAGDLEDRRDDDAIAEFNRIYQRWLEGELAVSMPGGESGHDVLDRYLPVLTTLRLRYLDDRDWTGDIVVVSHGAAIRLAAATLAGVEASFVLDHHLANTEAVALAPITDGRWSCVRWGVKTPPFYPEPDVHPVEDALRAADPMG